MEIERRVREKKNQSVLGKRKKIFLSSCSLVGLYVNLQVKVTEKFDENSQSIFFAGRASCLHTLGRHVVEHGKNLKLEIYIAGKI
jgi:hypothetical protein